MFWNVHWLFLIGAKQILLKPVTCYPFEQVKKVINEEMKQSKILAYITALKKLCNHPKVHISGE